MMTPRISKLIHETTDQVLDLVSVKDQLTTNRHEIMKLIASCVLAGVMDSAVRAEAENICIFVEQ